MQDRLNFFEPWDHRPACHEDQLTRALLVVLRYCPIAHQAWLSLFERNRALYSLPRPIFDTQRGKILRSEGRPATDEPIEGISVFCSADAPSEAPPVLESDRLQILDGIIRYGDDIVVVLESKLDGPADDWQATYINLHGQPIDFHGRPIRKISWRNVLARFTDLANEERGLISGAERMILIDFLAFVDTNFPHLGPFNTLERCEREPSRIGRRLHTILSEILASEASPQTDESCRMPCT
jgi:hypothetical protein